MTEKLELTPKEYIFAEAALVKYYNWKFYNFFLKPSQCSICLCDMYGENVLETGCGHPFHYRCILISLVDYHIDMCPECQRKYEPKNNENKNKYDTTDYMDVDYNYFQ